MLTRHCKDVWRGWRQPGRPALSLDLPGQHFGNRGCRVEMQFTRVVLLGVACMVDCCSILCVVQYSSVIGCQRVCLLLVYCLFVHCLCIVCLLFVSQLFVYLLFVHCLFIACLLLVCCLFIIITCCCDDFLSALFILPWNKVI